MPTKTDLVKARLAKKPNPDPEEIKKWADDIGCSPALIYKWKARLPEGITRAVEAHEPVVRVDEEPEIIEEPVEEEGFEPPAEFAEEPTGEEAREEAIEAEELVIEEEEEAEEERLLRAISKRAIKLFFGIAIEEGLGLGKEYGLTDQESEDTEVLVMLFVAKYAMVKVKENLLEITGGLHFGSIALKLLVAWIKKRRKEAKRKEEEEAMKPKAKEETIEEPVETPVEEEATEEPAEKTGEEAEKEYRKRVLGGR